MEKIWVHVKTQMEYDSLTKDLGWEDGKLVKDNNGNDVMMYFSKAFQSKRDMCVCITEYNYKGKKELQLFNQTIITYDQYVEQYSKTKIHLLDLQEENKALKLKLNNMYSRLQDKVNMLGLNELTGFEKECFNTIPHYLTKF